MKSAPTAAAIAAIAAAATALWWSAAVPAPAWAAKPKKKDQPKAAPAAPIAPTPSAPPVPPQPPSPPPPPEPAAPAPPKPAPAPAKPPAQPVPPSPVAEPGERLAPLDRPTAPRDGAVDSPWEGFFVSFGVGAATTGSQGEPNIPDVEGTVTIGTTTIKKIIPLRQFDYGKLVTTDAGGGLSACLQFGYNVLGYGSLWLDIAAHGNLSSDKKDFAGGGGVSLMAGLHPIAWFASRTAAARRSIAFDLKLYGGYTPLEVLAYNENQVQGEWKAKAWMGSAVPFGLHAEWKPKVHGGFALGLDLRAVRTSYTQWYFSWDREEFSRPSPPVTTLRFEPRLTLNAHF